MNNTKLHKIIQNLETQRFATDSGTTAHNKMQNIFFTQNGWTGDTKITAKLAMIPEATELFGPLSKTEVPIAGYINGKFISRRIDRLYINPKAKQIIVIDYKSDTDKRVFYDKYRAQLHEYYELLRDAYPDFDIQCKILWLCDFTLENLK